MTNQIKVDNIKCGGCANHINKKLLSLSVADNIDIDIENGVIRFDALTNDATDMIRQALLNMGYPESGQGNVIHTAKSFVSCMLGRMDV